MADWSADERKLNTAYENIQQGRLKPAQADVDRWLKKHPKSQPAIVLRMMLAHRQGLGRDAVLKAYDDVRKTGTLSGRSVWRVAVVLRSIRRQDLVLALFQELWDAHPNLVELADQVFFEAAALGDTAIMATATRKTFNLSKVPERARLAAYSAWANAIPLASPDDANSFPVAPARALLPAYLLLRTTGDAVPTADVLWLRLQVALGNGDEAEGLRLIREHGRDGALSRRWVAMEAAKVLAERSADPSAIWNSELAHVISLLRSESEAQHNYAFYKHAMASAKGAGKEEEIATLFRELVTKIGDKERAPLLAVLELATQHPMPQDEWEAALKNYLGRWGSKWTTVSELVGISGDRTERVRELVRESIKPFDDERGFCTRSVAELYLRKGRTEASLEEAKRLWKLYLDGLAYGKNLPKTDPQPADPIALAAVDEVLTLWKKSSKPDLLFTAATMLEYILKTSPSSFSARFTLVRVYRLLGAGSIVVPHLAKLDLTEIQLDNLLHVLTERGALEAELGGYKTTWDDIIAKAQFMYSRSATDLPEYVKQMLQHESYSKVHGLRSLRDKLDRSLSQRVLEVEELSRSLTEASESTVENLTAGLKDTEWSDNRSYELMIALDDGIDEATVRALGGAALRVATFLRGEETDVQIPTPAGVVDAAYVSGIDVLLRAAGEGSPATVFDASIAAYAAAKTSVESRNALLALAQLSQVVDAVAGRVVPSAKGKKRTPAQLAFSEGLKEAKGKLGTLAPREIESVSESKGMALSIVEDEEFVDELLGRVKPAQDQLAKSITAVFK